MYYKTDDPARDFLMHDAEQAAAEERLPVCADCGETVQDDHYYEINDEVICPDCLESGYRKWVDDYIF